MAPSLSVVLFLFLEERERKKGNKPGKSNRTELDSSKTLLKISIFEFPFPVLCSFVFEICPRFVSLVAVVLLQKDGN